MWGGSCHVYGAWAAVDGACPTRRRPVAERAAAAPRGAGRGCERTGLIRVWRSAAEVLGELGGDGAGEGQGRARPVLGGGPQLREHLRAAGADRVEGLDESSDERRVGKGGVLTCGTRGWAYA